MRLERATQVIIHLAVTICSVARADSPR